jgi:GGDEF domain-containing protein
LSVRAQAHRLGGDEFAITCELGDVSWIEKMLTQAVEDLHISGFETAGVSSGSVHVREAPGKEELKHMADSRMYENKRLRKRSRYENQENQAPLRQF